MVIVCHVICLRHGHEFGKMKLTSEIYANLWFLDAEGWE